MRGAAPPPGAIALLLALAWVSPAAADPAASKNNEGNRLYNQKRYDDALKMYTDAQASRPDASELHYNIGNVLFRKKEYDKAVEEYLRAQAAANPALSEAATFNRGNALMLQGRPEDAIKAYVQALRARPDDGDAKRNLELALRLLQQKKQQQQQDKQDQKQPKQPPQQGEGGGKAPPQKRPGEMSEDEARQVLEALAQEEKEGIKKHARAASGDRRPPEEDW
ncbi:MAG TPA: tetratricopeptide repeat protein [Candidatus Dormibacteraeota bacterium]|nr:tetratricopeptide repeat protein [Candidatus Dormibacteraeota bacterium]